MKELKILVRLEGDKIQTLTSKVGFDKSPEGILQIIGILDNLKQLELDKLKKEASYKIRDLDNPIKDGDILL